MIFHSLFANGIRQNRSSAVYIALVCLSILNGLSYELFTWLSTDYDWRISPVFWVIVFVVVYGLAQETIRPINPLLWGVWGMVLLVPSSTLSWLVLLLMASITAYVNPKKDLHILIALLALSELGKAFLFKLVSFPVLEFEAALVTVFVNLMIEGVYRVDNIIVLPNGYSLSMSYGCSAFLNLSFVLVTWASVYYILHQKLPAFLAMLKVAAVFFLLNTARIMVMSIDPTWYSFAHDGEGKQLFDGLVVLLLLSPIFFSKRRSLC